MTRLSLIKNDCFDPFHEVSTRHEPFSLASMFIPWRGLLGWRCFARVDNRLKILNNEDEISVVRWIGFIVGKLPSFFKNWRQQRELLLLLVAGFITLLSIDTLMLQGFQRDQEYRQTLMAQKLQAELQSALDEHVTALIALNVVYQNFVEINAYDFQQYGHSITANLTGFRRLFYVDPGLTLRQVYPYSPENRGLYGLSLQSNASISQLLMQAKASQKPATSGLIPFLTQEKTLLAAIPIYRNTQEFLGYAVGEIALDRVWDPLSHADFLKQYQVQLLDPQGRAFFQGINLQAKDRILTRVGFKVANQKWSLLLQPIRPASEALWIQQVSLWATGLLILLLMSLLITGTKRHKEALGEAQEQFETIFKASPDGMILLDDQLRLQLTNPPLATWTGLQEAELQEKSFFDLFQCQCPHLNKCRDLSFLLCTSDQFEEAVPETLEAELLVSKGGAARTLRLNASRIQRHHGKAKEDGFICVLGDISTRKELERVKETYIATLTHDLRTPLLAQEMVLESVLSGTAGATTPAQEKLLSGASQSARDLIDMVEATLVFYKIESSHLVLNKHRLPLVPMIKEVMAALQPLAGQRGLVFELEVATALPEPSVDPVQLKRVFHNLLSNAISYAARDTVIRARVQVDEGQERLVVEIENQGKGIAAEELPKIFEKYYSLSRKFKQIGTGLGLYISRRIVELHGGRIWAESEPDQKTTFFVALPYPQQI